jgi:hypothetical protein
MNLIGWPEPGAGLLRPADAGARRGAEGADRPPSRLQPAGAPGRTGALERGCRRATTCRRRRLPVPGRDFAAALHAEEAQRVGLVDESGSRLGRPGRHRPQRRAAEAAENTDACRLRCPACPAPTNRRSPPRQVAGRPRADRLQPTRCTSTATGRRCACRTSARAQLLRLHPRHRHQQTVSLTHRMLVRLCETGRLRAFEKRLAARARHRARAAPAGGAGGARSPGRRPRAY